MNCLNPECPAPVLEHTRICVACGCDNGYPNVRRAESEQEALGARFAEVEIHAKQRGCYPVLESIRETLKYSVAVIATNPNRAHALLSDPSEAYTNFYRVTESGARSPRPNWFDEVRGIADELLFPNYRDRISFGALSLDGSGCWYYGSVHLVLANFAVSERATVFEENSLYFCRRRQLGVHAPVPPGFRATWNRRDELAAAKLEALLNPDTKQDQFAGLVISRPNSPDADFVEVHIYDRLNRYSVARVIAGGSYSEDDEIMKLLIKRDCERAGIPFSEIK